MIPRDKHILDALQTMSANLSGAVKELQSDSPDMNFVVWQLEYTVRVLNEYIPVIFDQEAKAKIIPLRIVGGIA